MNLPDPEQVAKEIIGRSCQNELAIDLDRIVRLWPNLRVSVDSLENEGYLVDLGIHGAEIVIRAGENPNRRRYTIAHELGHWFLINSGSMTNEALTDEECSKIERWCDAFAAHLLIPRKTIVEFTEWSAISIQRLIKKASELEVSLQALIRRVLEEAPYSGGVLWFRMMGKPTNKREVKLRLDWGKFPKSKSKMYLPQYDSVPKSSPIYLALMEPGERLCKDVNLDFGSLRGRRNLLVYTTHLMAVTLVIPEEVNPNEIPIENPSLMIGLNE